MQSLISNMKKFFIITNEHKDMNLAMTNAISDYIIAKGGTCMHYVSTKSGWRERNLRRFQPSDIDAECIIVLGGDGYGKHWNPTDRCQSGNTGVSV